MAELRVKLAPDPLISQLQRLQLERLRGGPTRHVTTTFMRNANGEVCIELPRE